MFRMEKTIKDAVIEALKRSETPLSAAQVYDAIVKDDLYKFKAKAPQSLVTGELRRHCEGLNLKTSKPEKHFRLNGGKYSLLKN